MPVIRLIAGSATHTSFRALVLVQRTLTPAISMVRVSDGVALTSFSLTPFLPHTPAEQQVDQELINHEVSIYRLEATQLNPETSHVLTATAGSGSATAVIKTLPMDLYGKSFTVAVGTCYYDGYHRDAHYLAALKSNWLGDPTYKILAGDNIYLDVVPAGDFGKGAFAETVGLYLQYWWRSGYSEALAYQASVFTSDDHEFWNNFPEVQPHLPRSIQGAKGDYAVAAQTCYLLFQAWLNPDPVVPGGLSFTLKIPPLNLFVAETRANRTKHGELVPSLLPDVELQAFEQWAAQLDGPGLFVLGQPLWIDTGDWRDHTPPDFERQYAKIWRAIAKAPHDILIVSGDVHHSRLLQIALPSNQFVYEFVSSPACHIPALGSVLPSKQGHGTVKFPASVPVYAVDDTAIKPKWSHYFFGTDVPNTIGLLEFTGPSAEGTRVSVSAAFIDVATQQPAQAVTAQVGSEEQSRSDVPTCVIRNAFFLR